MRTFPAHDEMLQAVLQSDQTYDGVFFTGVKTTGVFCRPSCSDRKAKIKNLQFFPTAREAIIAGYRPCLRCKPLEDSTSPEWVRGLLDALENSNEKRLCDTELKSHGYEPARVRRYFLSRYGMTFHVYARARRLATAFTKIREGAALDTFAGTFGEAPGAACESECICMTWVDTPVGPMVAGATLRGICFLEFTDRRMFEAQMETLRRRFGCAVVPGDHPLLGQLRTELAEYFDGGRKGFDVPLDLRGTEFQEQVWRLLLEIPYGATWSYEELARRAGNPAAIRAVGRANGMNRIAILVPCHRVVNKNGQLGGYGGGLWRKTALLELERGPETPKQTELSLLRTSP